MSFPGSTATCPSDVEEGEITTERNSVDNVPNRRTRGSNALGGLKDTQEKLWPKDMATPPARSVSPLGGSYDSDGFGIPSPVRQKVQRTTAQHGRREFDFNDGAQALPWNRQEHNCIRDSRERQVRNDQVVKVRRFYETADEDLLVYLKHRQISPEFLHEIDLFLQAHPEIADCPEGQDILYQLSALRPLRAYLYFLKGYTQPARYIDGIIKKSHFKIPASSPYYPLSKKYDTELIDFFDGFEYRHDVIDRIDHEVQMGIQKLNSGVSVPLALRKLISYAVWGNPVDAYKWYEYSYQQDYLPHHYLPEHVMLSNFANSSGREPRMTMDCVAKKHLPVRSRMARASDQGVDVLHVLMSEYRSALVRRGHRRVDIDKLYASAKRRLEDECRNPTGAEIVDLIMDHVYIHTPQARRTLPLITQIQGQPRPTRLDRGLGTRGDVSHRTLPVFLQVQGNDLRDAKNRLQHLYTLESEAFTSDRARGHPELRKFQGQRATAERSYVDCLVRYQRSAKQMNGTMAAQLKRQFTRDKMRQRTTTTNRSFLMGLYPKELN